MSHQNLKKVHKATMLLALAAGTVTAVAIVLVTLGATLGGSFSYAAPAVVSSIGGVIFAITATMNIVLSLYLLSEKN